MCNFHFKGLSFKCTHVNTTHTNSRWDQPHPCGTCPTYLSSTGIQERKIKLIHSGRLGFKGAGICFYGDISPGLTSDPWAVKLIQTSQQKDWGREFDTRAQRDTATVWEKMESHPLLTVHSISLQTRGVILDKCVLTPCFFSRTGFTINYWLLFTCLTCSATNK